MDETSKQDQAAIIYTDGACRGNPGAGGYSALVIVDKHRKSVSGGFRKTTNNRMELMAVIAGLESLGNSPREVTVFTDSTYVCNAFNKNWLEGWEAKKWKRADASPVPNNDLWQRLLKVTRKHKVSFEWVKGHAGNTFNGFCDRQAVSESKKHNLEPDIEYEKYNTKPWPIGYSR